MNAIVKFTFASLKANRVRTLVTIAGIVLAAALLTAVLTTYTSLTHFLYESEAALSGTWTTLAQAPDSEELQQQIDEARTAPGVEALATVQDVGFGELTPEQQSKFGYYLPVQNVTGDVEEACAIAPSIGRMPERAGEVMLWQNWHEAANVQLGDTLTLQVGQRRAVLNAEAAAAKAAERAAELDKAVARGIPVDEEEYANGEYGDVFINNEPVVLDDGEILDSRMGYLSTELYGDVYDEELVDTHERTFTVVGFYERGNYALASSMGNAAITVDDVHATGLMTVYLTMTDATNEKELVERTEELFPDADVSAHTAMLRFLGIGGSGYIWDTFFGLATVLAVVIVVACVSLIYNAFAISVAERTSQFGLLSSIGASKRQIRRSVLLEALLVACIGIPLGVLVGLAGCAVTFMFVGPMIVSVLGDFDVPFDVHPAAWALIFSCALTLVAVLVSAYLPALRASGKNIIDALRWTTGGQVSKKGKRLAARNANPDKMWKRGIGMGRLLGAGGMLARINRKRGATKGRTAAVSLTLAIALLMTAGSLSTFLGHLTDAADYGIDYDIELCVSPDNYKQDALGNIGSEKMYGEMESIFAAAADLPEVESVGWKLQSPLPGVMHESMAGAALRNTRSVYGGFVSDDQVGTMVLATFLDDATFEEYVTSMRFDMADFTDPAHPRAIGVGTIYGNDGERYQRQQFLQGAGMVRLYVGGTFRGETIDNFSSDYEYRMEADGMALRFLPEIFYEDSMTMVHAKGLDDPEVALETVSVDVAALADHAPAVVGNSGALQLIMSRSLLPRFADATLSAFCYGAYDVVEGLPAQADEAIQEAATDRIAELGLSNEFHTFTNDYASMQNSNKMLATIVRVFCLLFTVILALIAMANVFNTVTNSLILRRREFAVMRSIGLSNGQFRRMIAGECTGFALVGLVAGMVISLGITYVVYRIVTWSIDGIPFMLPWAYVCLSIAMTAAAMLISVAYAMHRCKADNVVEALRMGTI